MPLGPGFHYQPIRWELLGETPDDWRAYIPVAAPHLCDSGDVISIGDRYFLSMGAHATHEHLLMDKTAMEPLTIAKSFAATALVAFAIDSPVVPQHREDQAEYAAADLDKFSREPKSAGLRKPSLYFDALLASAEAAAGLIEVDLSRPFLPMREIRYGKSGTWPHLEWPTSASTWRGVTAYSAGLQSVS